MKKLIENHCHCLHVDELQEAMEDRENEIIHIAKYFRYTIAQIEVRIAAIAADIAHAEPYRARCNTNDQREERKPEPGDESDGIVETTRKSRHPRGTDDFCSKCMEAGFIFKGGIEGPTKLTGWQDKQVAYLSSKKLEVARWLLWASIQKDKVDVVAGGGGARAKFPEAIYVDRQIYEPFKSATEGPAYKIVRTVEPAVPHDVEDSKVGSRASISFGF